MVQILQPQSRQKPSFLQSIVGGLSQGASQAIPEYFQKQAQMKQMQQENEAAKQMGIDLSGISDPKMRQAIVAESLKMQGKQQLQGQKQGFLEQVFGGGRQQQNQMEMQEQLEPQSNQMQQQGFDPSNISDKDIAIASSMDPNLGRSLMHMKDVALRERREEKNLELQKLKTSPEYQRQQHLESSQAQSDVKYNQSLQEASKQHELKQQTLDRLEALNKKGVTGKPYEKLLEKMGLVNLTSEGRREFAADVKNLITDIRSILGGQFSAFEFQTILNAYPSADFSKEANESIIKNLKDFQDIKKKEVEFAQQLKKENKGKLPEDFQSKVNEKVRDYAASKAPSIKENTRKIMAEEYGITPGNVLLFDPNGEPLDVPRSEVSRYLELGATEP